MNQEQKEQLERCLKISENNLKKALQQCGTNMKLYNQIYTCFSGVCGVLNSLEE